MDRVAIWWRLIANAIVTWSRLIVRAVVGWWRTLEEPPEWTATMLVVYLGWIWQGILLAAGTTMVPGVMRSMTLLLSAMLIVGGTMGAPSTLTGWRWAEQIGSATIIAAVFLAGAVFLLTPENATHNWFRTVPWLMFGFAALHALRLKHISVTAYRRGSWGARRAREAADSWKRHSG